MSNKHDQENGNGDRKVKLAIGGAVLELARRWGVLGLVGWIAVQQGLVPVPGIEIKKAKVDALPRAEFDLLWKEHEKWGYSVIERLDGNVAKLDGKMDRVIERLDRALDKRLVLSPVALSATNTVATQP